MQSDDLPIGVVVEGMTDRAIMSRVLDYVELPCGTVYIKNGRQKILEELPKYNQAARFLPWLVMVDLDQKPDCAPELIEKYLPSANAGMRFRVAAHAIEAWLLADKKHLAAYLHVQETKFPVDPDIESNPKITLINLARLSTRKEIYDDMVLPEGRSGLVGPGYTARLIEFVERTEYRWRPEVAINHSDSLRRCIEALRTLKDWKPAE